MTAQRPVVAFAPGRVNVLGEHTDYNGGLALPFAIAQGVRVRGTPVPGDTVEVVALDLGEEDRFALSAAGPAAGWRAFARGVAAELRGDGVAVPACRLEVSGDVPRGGGLSSSAALTVALALALLALAGEQRDRLAVARLCSRVENDWVGARTGLLDQLASLHGRAGTAARIDFASFEVRPVPLALGAWRFVTLPSREERALAASGYNARRQECTEAVRRLGVASLRDLAARGHDLPAAARALPDPLDRRVRHVLEENARVDAGVAALERGDLATLGPLLDASHTSLRDFYDASTPAVEAAVQRVRDAGAAGARMFGGGFGGHVLGLFAPGVEPPAEATVVAPGDGARVA